MIRPTAQSATRILAVLSASDKPLLIAEIIEVAYVSYPSAKNHAIPALIAAGLVHQAGWQKGTHGKHLPTYAKGQGVTPPRPDGKNSAHRAREWRERTAANQFNQATRRLAKPDPITAALLGL